MRELEKKTGYERTLHMNTHSILAAAVIVTAAISCQRVDLAEESIPFSLKETVEFTAGSGDLSATRTTLMSDGSVWWAPQDSIKVFYGELTSGKFVSKSCDTIQTTVFSGTFDTLSAGIEAGGNSARFWGVHPYTPESVYNSESVSLSVPPVQTAVEGTFNPGTFPSIAVSDGLDLAFYNVCGGVRFTVSQEGIKTITIRGNSDESIAGDIFAGFGDDGKPVVRQVVAGKTLVTLNALDGTGFVPGKAYYAVLLPGVLSEGITVRYYKDDSVGIVTKTSSLEIKRSVFGKVTDADASARWISLTPVDLSASGTANCYIVPEAGMYKFKTVKGNSDVYLGSASAAEVLWESFGTDETPSVGDLVSDACYSDNYITFEASDKKGNAVIAVKGAAGTILWSWHIWMTDKPEDQVYNNNAGTMMDRNLGATSATPGDVHALGLMYQWGRKDPFLGGQGGTSNTRAASTATWPATVTSDSSTGKISYVITNPMVFIVSTSSNRDWYYTGSTSTDNTRWSSTKSLYDPCPYGYRVPDGGSSGVWAKAFNATSSWTTASNWDSTNHGYNFASTDKKLGTGQCIWYPAAGDISMSNGSLLDSQLYGTYWSATTRGGSLESNAYFLSFHSSGKVLPCGNQDRARGRSVRCWKRQ